MCHVSVYPLLIVGMIEEFYFAIPNHMFSSLFFNRLLNIFLLSFGFNSVTTHFFFSFFLVKQRVEGNAY